MYCKISVLIVYLSCSLFVCSILADQCKLKQLVKFWVAWELPMKDMQVKVVQAEHPTSSTCFCVLRLPAHYTTYDQFKKHLESCIATSDVGFGLV